MHNFKFNIFLNLGYRLNSSRKQCFTSNMKTNSWRILDLMKPSKVSYDKIVEKNLIFNKFIYFKFKDSYNIVLVSAIGQHGSVIGKNLIFITTLNFSYSKDLAVLDEYSLKRQHKCSAVGMRL